MIEVEVVNEQRAVLVDAGRLHRAVLEVLKGESVTRGRISVAIVDDATIHDLNRRYLNHDEPTDVLSFVLDRSPGSVEGEIVASGEMAAATSGRFDWASEDELLLYVVHGALHLAGFDDATPAQRATMQAKERGYLAAFGLEPSYLERDEREGPGIGAAGRGVQRDQ